MQPISTSAPLKNLANTDLAGKNKKLEDAKEVAKEFEALFFDMMLKSMRQTVPSEETNHARDTFQGMLDSEHAKQMADNQNSAFQTMLLDWMKNIDPDISDNNPKKQLEALKQNNEQKIGIEAYKNYAK